MEIKSRGDAVDSLLVHLRSSTPFLSASSTLTNGAKIASFNREGAGIQLHQRRHHVVFAQCYELGLGLDATLLY